MVEANPEDIKISHVDVSQEPAGLAEDDVKSNDVAEEEDAIVHDESVELQKQDEPKVEEKLDVNYKGEESTSPKTKEDKVEENERRESSSPKTEDKLDAKYNVDVSSHNAEENDANDVLKGEASSSVTGQKSDYLKSDEIYPLSDLQENEKKALEEFRAKVEEAISANKLFKEKQQEQKEEPDQKAKPNEEKSKRSEPQPDEQQKRSVEEEEPSVEGRKLDKGKTKVEDGDGKVKEVYIDTGAALCLWGVPLLPSRGDKRTDVILLKFLKAKEFKVNDALEMLRNALQYRKENNIDSILEEDFGTDYDPMSSISGVDRRGHPVCYNVYGVFGNEDLYNKTFGTQEGREKFLRWRLQLMERQIQKLDFRPEGVSSLLQINDLQDAPGPSRKDLRVATRQAVALLQENYPEFVSRNVS